MPSRPGAQAAQSRGQEVARPSASAAREVMRPPLILVSTVLPLALASGPRATIIENESRTLEDIRSVLSAQSAYASFNGGLSDELRCLVEPVACLPGYAGPVFLDRELASLAPRHGYRRQFHPGRRPRPEERSALSSASSLVSFAYTAVPIHIGVTGNRGFCADSSDGFIRETEHGPESLVTPEGRCSANRMAEDQASGAPEENERRTIADIRILMSAQEAYRAANGGFFGPLECLAEPLRCHPGWGQEFPALLDPRIAELRERHGYRRRFYPGARPRAEDMGGASPTSLLSYAYTAVPAVRGRTGRRGFCTDSQGLICETADGSEPSVRNAQCDPCQPLR